MGRISRELLLSDGCYAHVFTRSFDQRKIFVDAEDFEQFRIGIKKVKRDYPFRLYHYCIMQTHVHMVVEIIKLGDFSSAMRLIKKDYAQYYNLKHKRFGPVWRDRYKAKLIENAGYLAACGRYVEQNPVAAGIVDESTRWPYSSSLCYEEGKPDEIIDDNPDYGADIQRAIRMDKLGDGPAIGSEWFQFQICRKIKS